MTSSWATCSPTITHVASQRPEKKIYDVMYNNIFSQGIRRRHHELHAAPQLHMLLHSVQKKKYMMLCIIIFFSGNKTTAPRATNKISHKLNLFDEAQTYFHFLSFISIGMAQVVQILPHGGQGHGYPIYPCLNKLRYLQHNWRYHI